MAHILDAADAPRGVRAAFRAAHPDIPWIATVSMRNRLIHAYFDVDLRLVWKTAREVLPAVAAALRSARPGRGA